MTTDTSIPADLFEKVLQAFESGDLPYADVQSQLQQLIAGDASPEDLLEVLQRRESIEPLPPYAHAELHRLLKVSIARSPSRRSGRAVGLSNRADTIAVTPTTALAADLESKARDLDSQLTARFATVDSTRRRDYEARRESEQYQSEQRTLRDSVAARDATIALMRLSGAERDSQLAGRDSQLAERVAQLAERDSQLAERDSQLAECDAQLAERDAQLAERELQFSELQREHAKRIPALDADLAAARTALQAEQQKSQELQRLVTECESRIIEMRQVNATIDVAHQARIKSVEAEAAAGRLRGDSLALEIKASQHAATELTTQRDALRTERDGLRTQCDALRTECERWRTQAMDVKLKLEAREALVSQLHAAAAGGGERAQDVSTVAEPAEKPAPDRASYPDRATITDHAKPLDRATTTGQAPASATAQPKVGARSTLVRPIAACAAILLLAILAWFLARRPTAPAKVTSTVPVPTETAGTVIRDCPTCPALTVLPAGRFQQGSPPDTGALSFEKPQRWVVIALPFAMSTNAVTVEQFSEFATATERAMRGCDTYDGEWRHQEAASWENPGFAQTGKHPATCASWDDAKAYAFWLSSKTGHRYRLPSASEWEYAARAGDATVRPWSGDGAEACANANVADESAARRYPGWSVFACDDGYVYTAPVGSFKANAFGLNDMLGNVFQWTEDCWHADYADAPLDGTARLDGDCTEHELRGGSWFSIPAYVRVNYRNHFATDYRTSTVGIRLVRDAS